MKTTSTILIFLSLSLLLQCDKDKNPIESGLTSYFYPTAVGNQWEYDRSFSIFNFRPDSGNVSNPEDTIYSISTMQITNKTVLLDSITAYCFLETITENGITLSDESYYDNRENGFYLVAYHNAQASTMIPKINPERILSFKGYHFNNIKELKLFFTKPVLQVCPTADSLIYENPPLLCLQYPVEIDSQWTYRESGNPWRIDKKVISKEEIEVPAGRFLCYKIQWLYNMDHDSEWDEDIIFYDWICEKGLIRRSILFKDVVAQNIQMEQIVLFDALSESVLTKTNL